MGQRRENIGKVNCPAFDGQQCTAVSPGGTAGCHECPANPNTWIAAGPGGFCYVNGPVCETCPSLTDGTCNGLNPDCDLND